MAEAAADLRSDLRVALLTGASGWRDPESQYTTPEIAVVVVLGSCVAAVVTVFLVSAGLPADNAAAVGATRWVMAALGAVTLLLGVAPTLAWPLGWRPRREGPTLWFALVRVAAMTLVVGCWTALLGPLAPAPIWLLGGVVGCEYTLTAWVLGVRTSGRAWWSGFLRSSVHLGIWGVALSSALLDPDHRLDLVGVPLSFEAIALGAAVTCSSLERLRRVLDYQSRKGAQNKANEVHRRLADWLHNDVMFRVGQIRREVQTTTLTKGVEGVIEGLDDLEHSLRVRQIDELFEAGPIELVQVLQPYLELARASGVELAEVPDYGQTSVVVDSRTGRLVQQALGVLVPNAIAAGAKHLVFRVGVDESSCLWVEVEDDAGGFDLSSVPPGRGLAGLRRDLGSEDHLTCVCTDAGSRLRAVVEPRAGRDGRRDAKR